MWISGYRPLIKVSACVNGKGDFEQVGVIWSEWSESATPSFSGPASIEDLAGSSAFRSAVPSVTLE